MAPCLGVVRVASWLSSGELSVVAAQSAPHQLVSDHPLFARSKRDHIKRIRAID